MISDSLIQLIREQARGALPYGIEPKNITLDVPLDVARRPLIKLYVHPIILDVEDNGIYDQQLKVKAYR